MSQALTFRMDDVSCNSVMSEVNDIAFYLKTRFPECRIIYGISPLVFSISGHNQRVFPKILTAQSDHKEFFKADKMGIPGDIPDYVEKASHGLFHVDMRLLRYECQEMSILASCSLVGTSLFVPPFNKWNGLTEDICRIHKIGLIKFEEGWRSLEHEPYDPEHKLWYFHHWAFGLDKVKNWLGDI